jgi:hypothetical protein
MNRWTRVLIALSLFAVSIAAISACSLRYDFDTECETTSDCEDLETIDQTDPVNNELYTCNANNKCELTRDECRTAAQCPSDNTCENGTCMSDTIDPDADGGDDADGDGGEVIDNTCESDDDCDDGEACGTSGECAPVDCSTDGDSYCESTFGDNSACNSDSECASTECTATTYCIDNFGDSYYCPNSGNCVDTSHPLCEDIFYPSGANTDDVTILGTIIPTTVQGYTSVGPTIRNGARMAVIEYANSATDLINGDVVAHLQCEGGTQENALTAANHLRDIGVPVVVGPLTSSNYLQVVENVTGDPDDDPVVTIAMAPTSPAIGFLNSSGTYSFQIIANDRFQSSALVDRAKDLNQRSCTEVQSNECTSDGECQAAFGADWVYDSSNSSAPCSDSDPKVAVFWKNDKYGSDLQQLVTDRIPNLYPSSEATFEFFQYKDPASLDFDPDEIASNFGTVIAGALNTMPDADVNIFIGTGEAVTFAKTYIDALGGQSLSPQTRQFIFSHGAAADSPLLFSEQGLPDTFLTRIEAVAPNIFNTTDGLFDEWQTRYSITFNEPAATTVGGLAYDSAFVAIFGMLAASADGDVTPQAVSQAIQDKKLQDSSALQIQLKGLTFPGEAKQQLGRGNAIDMVGVSGGLDFVYENGDNLGVVRSDYLGLTVVKRTTGAGDVIYEGQPQRIYILQSNDVVGSWVSLPGF